MPPRPPRRSPAPRPQPRLRQPFLLLAAVLLAGLAFVVAQEQPLLAAPGPEPAPGTLIPVRLDPEDKQTRIVPVELRSGQPRLAAFSVTYSGNWPAPARAAFQAAADVWSGRIASGVPIQVDARWESLSGGFIGEAGPTYYYRDFAGAPRAGTYYPSAVANRLAGADLNPSAPDITARMNSSYTAWYFGTDGRPPAGTVDFVTVALHEIGHGLGFAGSMSVSGGQGRWGFLSYPTVWDTFGVNGANQPLINTAVFPNPSSTLATQLQSGSVRWNGSNAVTANGGSQPRLYAPSSWQEGSSFLHLDEASYPAGNANSLMTPTIGMTEVIHEPGALVLAILRDLGWGTASSTAGPTPSPALSPTPTPATTSGKGTASPAPTATPAPTPAGTPAASPRPSATPAPTPAPVIKK